MTRFDKTLINSYLVQQRQFLTINRYQGNRVRPCSFVITRAYTFFMNANRGTEIPRNPKRMLQVSHESVVYIIQIMATRHCRTVLFVFHVLTALLLLLENFKLAITHEFLVFSFFQMKDQGTQAYAKKNILTFIIIAVVVVGFTQPNDDSNYLTIIMKKTRANYTLPVVK